MSEDRTQNPSKLRRQQARERGQAAHSGELTGAAGLLAAVALLGVVGGGLADALLALVRESFTEGAVGSTDLGEVIAQLRHLAFSVAWPLGVVTLGAALAAAAAHQAQVQGLWAPGLLAPDVGRLWALGRGPGLAGRGGRGVWSLLKTAIVVTVAFWVLRSDWLSFQRLGDLEPAALARVAGATLRHTALTLALALVVLGLIDFGLQHRRFEEQLRLTPQEEREDLRTAEGDPALRAQRRRIARTWRGDAVEILAGAAVVLTGAGGFSVVLAGGPPPRRVSVRALAKGVTAERLHRAAAAAGIACVEAPELARTLARRGLAAPPLTGAALAELAALWPKAERAVAGRGPG